MLRQMESKEYVVNGITCHITPFPAFKAAKLSGDLAKFIAPLASIAVPLLDGKDVNSLEDIDFTPILDKLPKALEQFNGDEVEKMLRKLLLSGNIVVEIADEEGEVDAQKLTEDVANEIFCGSLQSMYRLAFYVVQLNFGDFFESLPTQSGEVKLGRKKTRKKV